MKYILTLFLFLLATSSFSSESIKKSAKQINPPFSRVTTLKLNEITRSSLNIIKKFDEINTDSKLSKKFKKLKIINLKKQSVASLINMRKAVVSLRNGKEVYDEAILSGMLSFVEKVNSEINVKHSELTTE